MADWATISSLATAGGTLILAAATFSAVRSANRSARIAERALQEQRRPVLVHARLDDPPQKVRFADKHWIHAEGGETVIEEDGDTIYLGMTVRNVGAGIAVLQGWHTWGELAGRELDHRDPADSAARSATSTSLWATLACGRDHCTRATA